MQKIAEFLVKRRKLVLVFMIVLALISAVQIPKVGIITDMTHYLPDSSSMKQGMDIMEEEFNDMSIDNTIRVMFTNLKESEKDKLLDELSEIEYVASVSYESDSKEYNNGDYTLFILNIPYDYDTPEMNRVEAAVKENYSDYEMIYNVDNPVVTSIPNWIIGVSMTIMLVIMLVMGESYIEPLLFLASIGVAVVINMGTNVLLGSVSSSTYSISSLLQMVLSIDYSIILMERYRQELCEESDHQKAMTKAIHASFASIASSSITTVVGMLILCFMEFKIGMEMGTVLAKGVFISMICTLTVLPALILIFDKWIHKTAKHAPHFNMAFMGKFSFKARYIQTVLFVLLFAVLSVTQGNTEMSYSMTLATEINAVFPKSNPIIIFYENEDEETITKLSEKWEQTEGVNAIMSYGTVLGKPYTVTHLANEIREMEIDMGDMEMDEDMLRLLYYNYYSNDNLPAMTIKEFVTFLTDEVMTNDTFASEIDASMTENIDTMKKMTNAAELTKPMSIAEMAEFFDMGKEEVKQLYLLYFSNHGGVSTGKMTLPVFADFLVNEVANNPAYASMFTEEMKGQLQMILTFTDTEAIHAPMNDKQAAALLGMDEESAKMLYVSYIAQSEDYAPEAMEIHTFISFICNDLVNNPALSGAMAGSFDEATFAQLQNLLQLTDETAITAQLPAVYLAQAFSMDEETVSGIMMMTGNTTGTMSDDVDAGSLELLFMFYGGLKESNPEWTLTIEQLQGKYYFVGNSPMAFEMSKTFDAEMNRITILTALAIYVVILLTYRNFAIPLILVGTIQTAVYAIMTLMGMQGIAIYYLALIIVQSILMGSAVDYGILFTSYYREKRMEMGIKDALIASYNGSIHTFMTSGLILVVVTGLMGKFFPDPSMGEICSIISKGAFMSILLILFILPGVLAVCDKLVTVKNRYVEE